MLSSLPLLILILILYNIPTYTTYLYECNCTTTVAGHMPIISRQKGIVSKPAQADEVNFYENLHYGRITVSESFIDFIPRFFGCCYVDLDNLLEKGIKSRDGLTSFGGNNSRKSSPPTSEHAAKHGSSGGTSTASGSNTYATDGESDVEDPKPLSRKLWKRFKNERMQSKRLEFDDAGRCKYILLQDLTGDFHSPCILDIKMGTRQHADDDSPDKIARKINKCKKTTSATVGMRVCGMQVYQHLPHSTSGEGETTAETVASPAAAPSTSATTGTETASVDGPTSLKRLRSWSTPVIVRKEKNWGHKQTLKTLPDAMCLYFSDGSRVRVEVIVPLVERLKALKASIATSLGWRFYSSSLLLIYEGEGEYAHTSTSIPSATHSTTHTNTTTTVGGVTSTEDASTAVKGEVHTRGPHVDIRMIDFAHTVVHGDKTPDVGYLLGLHNLIAFLEGLLAKEMPDYVGDKTELIVLNAEEPMDKMELLSRMGITIKA